MYPGGVSSRAWVVREYATTGSNGRKRSIGEISNHIISINLRAIPWGLFDIAFINLHHHQWWAHQSLAKRYIQLRSPAQMQECQRKGFEDAQLRDVKEIRVDQCRDECRKLLANQRTIHQYTVLKCHNSTDYQIILRKWVWVCHLKKWLCGGRQSALCHSWNIIRLSPETCRTDITDRWRQGYLAMRLKGNERMSRPKYSATND